MKKSNVNPLNDELRERAEKLLDQSEELMHLVFNKLIKFNNTTSENINILAWIVSEYLYETSLHTNLPFDYVIKVFYKRVIEGTTFRMNIEAKDVLYLFISPKTDTVYISKDKNTILRMAKGRTTYVKAQAKLGDKESVFKVRREKGHELILTNREMDADVFFKMHKEYISLD